MSRQALLYTAISALRPWQSQGRRNRGGPEGHVPPLPFGQGGRGNFQKGKNKRKKVPLCQKSALLASCAPPALKSFRRPC